jgi:hypothetical protein
MASQTAACAISVAAPDLKAGALPRSTGPMTSPTYRDCPGLSRRWEAWSLPLSPGSLFLPVLRRAGVQASFLTLTPSIRHHRAPAQGDSV